MDVLSDILRIIKVRGSLYFRTAFRPPWGVRVPRFGNVARYHLVTRGACWVTVEGASRSIRLESGDLIVIPHGAEHTLADDPSTPPHSVDDVVRNSGFTGEGALVWGKDESEEPTSLLCGHFSFDSDRGSLLLQALPPFIHIRHTETLNYGWLNDAMKFIGYEAAAGNPGSEAIINRLSEIIFVQTVRSFAKTNAAGRSLFAALADPQIGRVLESLHKTAERQWSVEDMAKVAGMSRTLFSERMRQVLGVSPLAYLTQWRMELAREALKERRLSVTDAADAVGYQSLPAFSRAFKKHFGCGPGEVRRKGLLLPLAPK